jgi:hypothetical protein
VEVVEEEGCIGEIGGLDGRIEEGSEASKRITSNGSEGVVLRIGESEIVV